MTPVPRDADRGRRAARWIRRVGLWGGAVCLLAGVAVHLGAGPGAPPATGAENPDDADAGALTAAPQDDRFRQPVEEGTRGVDAGVLAPAARTPPDAERFSAPVEGRLPTEEERSGTGAAAFGEAALDASPPTRAGTRLLAALKHLAPAAFALLGTMLLLLGTMLLSVGAVFALLDWLGVLAAVADPRHPPVAPATARERFTPPTQGGGAVPAAGGATGGAASLGAEPQGARAAGTGSDEAERKASADGAGPTPHHATTTAPGGATRPDLGVQSPKPHAPMDEAGTPSFPAHEPPPPEPQPSQAPQSSDLIDAWDEYRRNGDGHFSPRGLQELLDQWELAARVSHGDRIGAGGAMLLVETSPGTPHFWVLPSFNKSPRAVADWFDDASSGALKGRTQHVARLARGCWLDSGTGRCEVVERGEVR